LQAVIDCVVKSYTSYELNPIEWVSIRAASLEILTPNGLENYQKLPEDEEDLQMQWEAAVGHEPLGVSLVLGQLGYDDMRALDDSENWEDTSHYDEMRRNVFLGYHMIKAHGRFLEENPEEGVHFRRFQLWYRQQAAGGHVPGRTWGEDGFWAAESEEGNESE
jgi:hypothetical protein